MNIRMTIQELKSSLNAQVNAGLIKPFAEEVTKKIVDMILDSGVLSEDSEIKIEKNSTRSMTITMNIANEERRTRLLIVVVSYGEVDIMDGYEVGTYAYPESDTLKELLDKTNKRLYELALIEAVRDSNENYFEALSYISSHTKLNLRDLLDGYYGGFRHLSEREINFIKTTIKESGEQLPESFVYYAERFFEEHGE